jgi:hypothetical protein
MAAPLEKKPPELGRFLADDYIHCLKAMDDFIVNNEM